MIDGRWRADAASRPPQSKTAYVVGRLRQDIATGVIAPGGSLRQTEIAASYGVSPTPVREALRILEAAGIIIYAPNRGATVRDLAPSAADDLYLLRAELEGFATELGVSRQDDTLVIRVQGFQSQLEAFDPAHDAAAMYEINRQLHFAFFEAGSELVAGQVLTVWEMFAPSVTIWGNPEIARHLNEDHQKIIEAAAARDPKLARKRMYDHVLNAARLRRLHVS